VLKDYKEGFRWLSKAAESGYPDAQYLKGKIYAVGMYGNLKDLKKSKIWVKKAHENGQKQARNIWEKYELWNY
jgi:TPR repeat protein